MRKILAALLLVLCLGAAGSVELSAAPAQMEESVTVKSGCSTAKIQEALNKNRNGDYDHLIVKIPAGTYKLRTTLYVYPNTTIQADAKAYLLKQSRYGAMLETKLVNDQGGYYNNYNITVDGGVWDSSALPARGGGTESFRFLHSSNITIKNADICNVPEGSHLITFAGVQNALVTNCNFYGYGDDGDEEPSPKEAIQLDTMHSSVQVPVGKENRDEVKWDDLPCDKITVTGCKFYEYSRGIGSHTAVAGVLHSNIRIIGNEFWDLSDSAIRLYNYKDVVVTDNVIHDAVEGILVYTYMASAEKSYFQPLDGVIDPLPANYNITIARNKNSDMKLLKGVWGDGIRVIGSALRPLTGVMVQGNVVTRTERYGIFATAAPGILVNANTVTDAAKHGILLEENCQNAAAYVNTVSRTGASGIAVYYSNSVRIYSNTVSDAGENGIYLICSRQCRIGTGLSTGNTINNPAKRGIYLTTSEDRQEGCTDASVVYNKISNAGTDGIGTYYSQRATIKGNTVTAKGNGIKLEEFSRYAVISGNQILKYAGSAEGYGILLDQSGGSKSRKVTVTGNTITGSGKGTAWDGIRLTYSSYVTVTKNSITEPTGSGILLNNSKNCVIGNSKTSYNTIKRPKNCGIYLMNSSDSGVVRYNRVESAKEAAIAVYYTKKVSIRKNRLSSKGVGISVNTYSKYSTIQDNTITSAGSHGIWLYNKSNMAVVKNNTIKRYGTAKKAYGIYVDHAGGHGRNKYAVISSNKIYGYGKRRANHAIRVVQSAYTRIQSNTVTSPAGYGICVIESRRSEVLKNRVTVRGGMKGIWISKSNYSIIKSNVVRNAKKGQAVVIKKSAGCKQQKNTK